MHPGTSEIAITDLGVETVDEVITRSAKINEERPIVILRLTPFSFSITQDYEKTLRLKPFESV